MAKGKNTIEAAIDDEQLRGALAQVEALQARIAALRPLDPRQSASLRQYFRIGLTYASNALEGNSLTLVETKIVIEDGLTVAGKPLRDHLEAQGHAEAFDRMLALAHNRAISEDDVRELHRLFYQRLDPEQAGRYRTVQIYLSGSEYRPPAPAQVPELMRRFGAAIPERRGALAPVWFAAWLHYELVTIHPFVDGNGRTARLLMNLALLQDGYPLAIIPPLRRAEYIQALAAAQTGQGWERYLRLMIDVAASSAHEYWRLLQ